MVPPGNRRNGVAAALLDAVVGRASSMAPKSSKATPWSPASGKKPLRPIAIREL